MSNNLRYYNKSKLMVDRANALIDKIIANQSKEDKNDVYNSTNKILEVFSALYSNIGQPLYKHEPFEPKNIRRSDKINKSMSDIESDLLSAYNETSLLNEGVANLFNYTQAVTSELLKLNEKVSSKLIDIKLLEGQQEQNVLIAGDDFKDLSKIDRNFPVQNTSADVLIEQGAVILHRTSSSNVLDQSTNIKVEVITPNISSRPTVDNINRFYEGKFYDFIGSARPEGGRFHLEQNLAVNVLETGVTTNTVVVSNPNPNNVINIAQQRINQTPGAGQQLRPEDIIIYDRGANQEEKDRIRENLVDNNPSTFWECEYVKIDDTIQNRVNVSRLLELDENSTILDQNGNIQNNSVSSVTLDDIRNIASANSNSDSDDLTVEIILTLQNERIVNWISITPNNFEESAWIDVLDISYSNASTENFITIPDFASAISENRLTEEVNSELSNNEVGTILAPNKFSFRGIGVWSFSPITAKVVKIRLRQRTATPAPYQRLAVRLQRTFTQVYTETEADTPGI